MVRRRRVEPIGGGAARPIILAIPPLLDAARAAGLPVVIQDALPVFAHHSAARCYLRNPTDDRRCVERVPESSQSAHRAKLARTLEAYRRDYPNIRIWSPWRLLCDGETCRSRDDAEIWFRDASHLSVRGGLMLVDDFRAAFPHRGWMPRRAP